jgi:hypothetical protein
MHKYLAIETDRNRDARRMPMYPLSLRERVRVRGFQL